VLRGPLFDVTGLTAATEEQEQKASWEAAGPPPPPQQQQQQQPGTLRRNLPTLMANQHPSKPILSDHEVSRSSPTER
jgi:hypothetical protein